MPPPITGRRRQPDLPPKAGVHLNVQAAFFPGTAGVLAGMEEMGPKAPVFPAAARHSSPGSPASTTLVQCTGLIVAGGLGPRLSRPSPVRVEGALLRQVPSEKHSPRRSASPTASDAEASHAPWISHLIRHDQRSTAAAHGGVLMRQALSL